MGGEDQEFLEKELSDEFLTVLAALPGNTYPLEVVDHLVSAGFQWGAAVDLLEALVALCYDREAVVQELDAREKYLKELNARLKHLEQHIQFLRKSFGLEIEIDSKKTKALLISKRPEINASTDDKVLFSCAKSSVDLYNYTSASHKWMKNENSLLKGKTRSNLVRDRFWLAIIVIWRWRLNRPLKLSRDPIDSSPTGPLIRLISGLSTNFLGPESTRDEAIFGFVKRHKVAVVTKLQTLIEVYDIDRFLGHRLKL